MKIAFVKCRYFDEESSTFWRHVLPPDGIARLAACLIKDGHQCLIYDMEPLKADVGDLETFLAKEKPDVVGFEIQTPNVAKCQLLAKAARRILPQALILGGGAHTFIEPEHTLRNIPQIDYVLRGECEETLPEFLRAYAQGKGKDELKFIAGVCFREGNDYVISKEVPLIQDVDSVPFGAFGLLPLDKYQDAFYPAKRLYATVTCRGCPNFCNFCGEPLIYGHKARARNAQLVVDEMEKLAKEYNVDYIVFQDATFNFNIARVKEICREILKRNLRLSWKIKARVDRVDEEMLRLLKQAGCKTIGFGVESAVEKSLKFLNKGYTLQQIKEAFRLTRKVGIDTLAYFMLGTEGETEEDIQKTIDFSIELKPTYAHYMITTPMYGSELYKYYQEQLRDVPLEKYLFFTGIVNTDKLPKEVIRKYHRRAYMKFYLRPSFFIQEILHLKSPKDFWLKFKYAFFMLYKIIAKK